MALWTPSNISASVVGWWDPSVSASVTTGTNGANTVATAVAPQLGTHSLTNATASSCPLYSATTQVNGLTVLNFTASQTLATAAIAQAQPFSVVVFCLPKNYFNSYTIILEDSSGLSSRPILFASRGDLSNLPSLYAGTTNATYGSDLVIGTGYFIAAQYDGASSAVSLNGTVDTLSANPGSGGFTTGLQLSDTNSGSFFQGYIGDVVLINGLLTAGIRQKLEGWIAWKWGVQASLPAGHPYASAAPTGASVYALAESSGSFAFTGSAETLPVARKLSGTTGSFAFTGKSAPIQWLGWSDTAPGSFSFAGHDAALSASVQGLTASLSAPESPDTAAAHALTVSVASLSSVESSDGASSTGSVEWRAGLSTAGPADSLAGAASDSWVAGLASIEPADLGEASASAYWKAVGAVTDPTGAASSTGSVEWRAGLSGTEPADSISSPASVYWSPRLSSVDRADSAAATGTVTLAGGVLAAVDPIDAPSAHGTVVSRVSLSAGGAPDSALIRIEAFWSALAAARDLPDSAVLTLETYLEAALGTAEAADSASISVDSETVAVLAGAGPVDSALFLAPPLIRASLSARSGPDSVSASGTVSGIGSSPSGLRVEAIVVGTDPIRVIFEPVSRPWPASIDWP